MPELFRSDKTYLRVTGREYDLKRFARVVSYSHRPNNTISPAEDCFCRQCKALWPCPPAVVAQGLQLLLEEGDKK